MGGTARDGLSNSKMMHDQLQRSYHAMSKESLLMAPGKLGAEASGKVSVASTVPVKSKPYNRLVPVPPP